MDDVAVERRPVDRLVEQQAGAEPVHRQGGDQRPILPAPAGDRRVGPLTTRRAAMRPGQTKVAPGLVDPDEAGGVDTAGSLAPSSPLRLTAFARPPRLFSGSTRSVG